jgi:hypothetical protein
MIIKKLATIMATAFLAAAIFVPVAHAGQVDQGTVITLHQAMRIPGHTLQPGTYYFALLDNGASGVNPVVIYNRKDMTAVAIVNTIPVERQDPSDKTILSLSDIPHSSTPALVDWFYPGELEGHQFQYSAKREKSIEHSAQIILATNSNGTEVVANLSGRPS